MMHRDGALPIHSAGVSKTLWACWRSRWPTLRLIVAASLLATFVIDVPSSLTRRQIAALPNYEYAQEADELRKQGRYGEALLVADAGLNNGPESAKVRIEAVRAEIIAERDSWLRRVKGFGVGALIGGGESPESILGAITADFFVVGDVRDILIQLGRWAADGETDELILALSALGLATTLLPAVDWAPAILKAARKIGAIGAKLAGSLLQILKRGNVKELQELMSHAAVLSKKMTPGGFVRALRHLDDPEDLTKLARYVDRHPDAAFALHVSGHDGIRWVTRAERLTSDTLVIVSRKGDSGVAWLRHGKARLLRPHPLIGVSKMIVKGNAAKALDVLQALLDPFLWLTIPALSAWVIAECLLLRRAFRRALVSRPAACP